MTFKYLRNRQRSLGLLFGVSFVVMQLAVSPMAAVADNAPENDQDSITVHGVVRDESAAREDETDSLGIAGIPVSLNSSGADDAEVHIADPVVSDEAGRFVFEDVPHPADGGIYIVSIDPEMAPAALAAYRWGQHGADTVWAQPLEFAPQTGDPELVTFDLSPLAGQAPTPSEKQGPASDPAEAAPPVAPESQGSTGGVMPMSFAEGGSGKYHGIIDWIEWGSANNEIVLEDAGSTKTVTSTREIGEQTLAVTCTASDLQWHQPIGTGSTTTLTPPLVAYTPGSWPGDGLDDLYNIGGAGYADNDVSNPQFPNNFHNPNEMVIGLANPNVNLGPVVKSDGTYVADSESNGANMSFNFFCEASLDGAPIPLEGLIFADAEASSGANQSANPNNGPEWVQATTSGQDVTWRIIERERTCTEASTVASWPVAETLRLGVNGEECTYQNNHDWPYPDPEGHGPMAIAFMEGATQARVGLQGRGYSAVAVGYVLAADFGDAPQSYGEAGALFQQEWSGGEVSPSGSTNVSVDGFELGTPSAPKRVILGEKIDAEAAHQFSEAATADDDNGIDDEDALEGSSLSSQELPISAFEGGTYTVSDITCYGPESGHATVAGWIDWNGNGQFDSDERARTTCAPGQQSVELTWDVPEGANPSGEYTFLRLRIAEDKSQVQDPTGISVTGEVEDHRLKLPAMLKVDKIWVIDGEEFEHGDQPEQLTATPTLEQLPTESQELAWGEWQHDYIPGDTVRIGETGVGVDAVHLPGCRLEGSTLEGDGIDGSIDLNLGNEAGSVTLPKVKNEYMITNTVACDPGEIAWEKVDDSEANPLTGSEWQLTGIEDLDGIDIPITDCIGETPGACADHVDKDHRGGHFKLTELPWGEYELVETKAPPGYVLDTTVRQIQIGEIDGKLVVQIDLGQIVNEQQDIPAIPLTGGTGAYVYTIAGGLAVLAAIALFARGRLTFRLTR